MSAGANVRIAANSSEYRQALKEAQQATKLLASEYTVASTQAKLFGTAADQLKVKQQELTAKLEAQKKITTTHHNEVERLTKVLNDQKQKQQDTAKAVEETKAKLEASKKATGEDSEETKALEAELQRLEAQEKDCEKQIASTEAKLNNAATAENKSAAEAIKLEKALEDTNKALKDAPLDAFEEKLNGVSEKLEAAQKGANVLSGAVVAVGAASVKSWQEVDGGLDNVIKATGATGDAAKGLETTYKRVAGSFAADFETIGSALGEVNTRFGYTDEDAEKCATQFLKFAEITGTDAAQAVDMVANAMESAGIDADDYSVVLDQMAVAAQASGVSIDSLAGNLKKFGAPMRALGFDTKESIAMFAGWEKAGVNTEVAFAGMQKAVQNWSKDGKDARVEFSKTLDQIKAAPDTTTATQIAMEAFGKKAGPELADAIKSGRLEYSDFLTLLENSEGTVTDTYAEIEDGGEAAKIAMNNLKLAGAELGNTLQEKATPYIKMAADKVSQLTEWLGNMDDGTKDTIVTVGLFVAGLAPAIAGVNGLVKGVSTGIDAYKNIRDAVGVVTTALQGENVQKIAATASQVAHTAATIAGTVAQKAMTAAQAALNAVMNANPILLVVTAIAALAAGLVIAYNTSDEFREKVDAAISKVKEIFTGLGEKAKEVFDKLKTGFADLKTKATEHLTNMANGAKQKWQDMSTAASEKFQSIKQTATTKLADAKNAALSSLQTMKENTLGRLSDIKEAYTRHGGGVKGAVAAYLTAVKGNYETVYNGINALTGGKLGTVVSTMQSKMNDAKSKVTSILWSIKDAFGNKMDEAGRKVRSAIDRIKGLFDFTWRLPSLKLPHVSIYGSFSLAPPSTPHFSVSWYKDGGIMTRPTAFNRTGNHFDVGGEAGPEAILPLEPFYRTLDSLLEDKISRAMEAMRVTVYVNNELDGDDIAAKTATRVEDNLTEQYRRHR